MVYLSTNLPLERLVEYCCKYECGQKADFGSSIRLRLWRKSSEPIVLPFTAGFKVPLEG